jgi:hypothetical protein
MELANDNRGFLDPIVRDGGSPVSLSTSAIVLYGPLSSKVLYHERNFSTDNSVSKDIVKVGQ